MTALRSVRPNDLDELAEVAVTEYGLATGDGREALRHAIACGHALLRAKQKVGAKTWREWVEGTTEIAYRTSATYMRFAFHEQKLPSDCAGITEAREFLVNEARVGGVEKVPRETKDEARRLRDEGATWAELSDIFGVSSTAVRAWVDPRYRATKTASKRRARHRQAEAKAALQRVETEQLAKKAGGSVDKAYSLLRRLLIELDRAKVQAEGEPKAALALALSHAHRAEDAIGRALRTGG